MLLIVAPEALSASELRRLTTPDRYGVPAGMLLQSNMPGTYWGANASGTVDGEDLTLESGCYRGEGAGWELASAFEVEALIGKLEADLAAYFGHTGRRTRYDAEDLDAEANA